MSPGGVCPCPEGVYFIIIVSKYLLHNRLANQSILLSDAFILGKLNEIKLHYMTKVTRDLYLYDNSDPRGVSAPVPGYTIYLYMDITITFIHFLQNGLS